jgi:hypothetical protein
VRTDLTSPTIAAPARLPVSQVSMSEVKNSPSRRAASSS